MTVKKSKNQELYNLLASTIVECMRTVDTLIWPHVEFNRPFKRTVLEFLDSEGKECVWIESLTKTKLALVHDHNGGGYVDSGDLNNGMTAIQPPHQALLEQELNLPDDVIPF